MIKLVDGKYVVSYGEIDHTDFGGLVTSCDFDTDVPHWATRTASTGHSIESFNKQCDRNMKIRDVKNKKGNK